MVNLEIIFNEVLSSLYSFMTPAYGCEYTEVKCRTNPELRMEQTPEEFRKSNELWMRQAPESELRGQTPEEYRVSNELWMRQIPDSELRMEQTPEEYRLSNELWQDNGLVCEPVRSPRYQHVQSHQSQSTDGRDEFERWTREPSEGREEFERWLREPSAGRDEFEQWLREPSLGRNEFEQYLNNNLVCENYRLSHQNDHSNESAQFFGDIQMVSPTYLHMAAMGVTQLMGKLSTTFPAIVPVAYYANGIVDLATYGLFVGASKMGDRFGEAIVNATDKVEHAFSGLKNKIFRGSDYNL